MKRSSGSLKGMRTHICSLETVLLLWAFSAVPAEPGCPSHSSSAPASSVLESLKCRNDYTTHINCSWLEAPGSQISLFHLDPDDQRVSPCVRGPLLAQNSLGQTQAQCLYNTSLFAIGFDDVFFFITPHSSGFSKTVNLTHFERRQGTLDLAVNITDEENWTLVWFDPEPSLPSVTPEVMTSDQSLTDQLNSRYTSFEEMDFKRFKNREDEFEASGLFFESEASGWSPLLPWKSSTDGLPGPLNLQCVYDGQRKVRCSWEMMSDLAQLILYNLSYRTERDAVSQWCCPALEKGSDDDEDALIRFSCLFSISEADQLLLDLRPQPRTKIIQSYKHIEPVAPVGFSVQLVGDDWVLNWTLPTYRTVPVTSELRYWSVHGDVETVSLPQGVSVCAMADSSLLSSTHYLAQVRSSVSSRTGPGARYAGYPSDWTQPIHWTTRPAPTAGVSHVYFLLAVSVSMTVILTYFILLAFHRRVKVWEVSLPSPFQSKALKAVCQARGHHLQSHSEVDGPCMSEVCVLGDLKQLNLHTLDWEFEDDTAPSAANRALLHQQASQKESDVTGLTQEDQSGDTWNITVLSSPFTVCSSVHRHHRLTFTSHNALEPCSEGYQQNCGASGGTTQNALQDTHLDDVEMDDGYMDCPK